MRVGRNEANAGAGKAHKGNGDEEDHFAAYSISQTAKNNATDRPDGKTDEISSETRYEPHAWYAAGEE
ncbi:hypothetical protein AA106556_0794 [Neokomagataea tanensis NBRC 106556]|uniref:Uncharacterized protein n=1 Tax=Neokomagataea tanensis NBRC 106556 TaxID=1223519 RepID=A0ABQ0QI06_9PROT|nr:hypothetical protein AA106556_0794 [Neokomagataea tanensis NBRC 106556]